MKNNPFLTRPTYVTYTGIELLEASSDRVTGRLVLNENHHQPYGLVHGGVYCTLIETLASMGAAMWATENGLAGTVGISNTTDFLRGTTDGTLLAEAKPIHRGRSQQVWEVTVRREVDDEVAAHGKVRLHNVDSIDF